MSEKNNQTFLVAEPGKQEIFRYARVQCTAQSVFKAYTDPKLYVLWLGRAATP